MKSLQKKILKQLQNKIEGYKWVSLNVTNKLTGESCRLNGEASAVYDFILTRKNKMHDEHYWKIVPKDRQDSMMKQIIEEVKVMEKYFESKWPTAYTVIKDS